MDTLVATFKQACRTTFESQLSVHKILQHKHNNKKKKKNNKSRLKYILKSEASFYISKMQYSLSSKPIKMRPSNKKLATKQQSSYLGATLLLISIIIQMETSRASLLMQANSQQIYSPFNERLQDNDEQNPNEDDSLSQLAESMASSASSASAAALATDGPQCEPISFSFCSLMPYNQTRMPNFFGDKNQFEAAQRAGPYEPLVASHCSRNLLSYLCELLAPMCLGGEAGKKFEVYPCRSLCRRIKRDCDEQLKDLLHSSSLLQAAFQCDKLPYESNGGTGELNGPCHESVSEQQQPQQIKHHNRPTSGSRLSASNNYMPYQPSLDTPPFVVDNSQLDLNKLKPNAGRPSAGNNLDQQATDKQRTQQQHQTAGWLDKVQSFVQWLAWTLMRYSNVMSIITLFSLLVLLNIERLNRFKHFVGRQVCSSSRKSSSSSSASSSVGSQRKLAASNLASKVATKVVTMSPSSSSRSLMLFAGAPASQYQHKLVAAPSKQLIDGGHKPHRHFQEQPTSDVPSQKLLHAAPNQRTLINVNGTLERLSCYKQLMQQQQQPQAIHQHQYDYIQYENNTNYNNYTNTTPQTILIGSDLESSSSGQHHSSSLSQQHQVRSLQSSKMSQPSGKQHQSSAQQKSGQMYSNILLSSPSHQVLLFDDNRLPPQPPLPGRQSSLQMATAPHRTAASSYHQQQHRAPSHTSPYASSLASSSNNNNNFLNGLAFGGGPRNGNHLQKQNHQMELNGPARLTSTSNSSSSSVGSSPSSASSSVVASFKQHQEAPNLIVNK